MFPFIRGCNGRLTLGIKVQFIVVVSTFYTTLARRSGYPTSIFTSSRAEPIRKTSISRRRADKRQGELPPYTDSTTNAYPLISIHEPDSNIGKDTVLSTYDIEQRNEGEAKRRE